MKLPQSFYNRSTLKVAQGLLGKFLIHKIGKKKIVGMIVETEAYVGFKDLASHAAKGKTARTAIMYGPPGFVYVYMIYGMYFCLNIVTEKEGYPAAVLIRAVESVSNGWGLKFRCRQGFHALPARSKVSRSVEASAILKISGPGRVCQYFKIDKKLNGENICGKKIWVENRDVKVEKKTIVRAKRVGVDYAGKYKNKLWRFYIGSSPFVSEK